MTYLSLTCAWCGGPLAPTKGPGRPRVYCRRSHRQRAYEAREEARARRLNPDEVVISRRGWEAMRDALSRLQAAGTDLAADVATGRVNEDYLRRVAGLGAAVAELQAAIEPEAVW